MTALSSYFGIHSIIDQSGYETVDVSHFLFQSTLMPPYLRIFRT